MKNGNEALKKWEKATIALVDEFMERYFMQTDKTISEWYFIGKEVGGVVSVEDEYFFDINRIVEALKYNATYDDLVEYNEIEISLEGRAPDINFKNFVRYGKDLGGKK